VLSAVVPVQTHRRNTREEERPKKVERHEGKEGRKKGRGRQRKEGKKERRKEGQRRPKKCRNRQRRKGKEGRKECIYSVDII
jgi:hypothetical protein